MATDLETTKTSEMPSTGRPSLKITGLHIRGLKSIRSLDLPADGLGWQGAFPDFVTIGGANGTGKTTLLEFLAGAFDIFICEQPLSGLVGIPDYMQASEAWLDFELSIDRTANASIRFLLGDEAFIQENAIGAWFGLQYHRPEDRFGARLVGFKNATLNDLRHVLKVANLQSPWPVIPVVVYFPCERKTFNHPISKDKLPNKENKPIQFVNRWQAEEFGSSLIDRLYRVRWEDLNALAEDRPEGANAFDAYAQAFARFFEDRKRIRWHHGNLVVETKDGTIHDPSDLSSGEKQVILFMGELLHLWRPGSLILIDEPELHLHESFQTQLWIALYELREERGGHFFKLGDPASKLILFDERRR